jgi:hypothetical protein
MDWFCLESQMAELTLTGISALQTRLRDIDRSIRDQMSQAMERDMEERVAERARNEFVPVAEGELRDSIRVESARVEQGRTETGQWTEGADLVVRVVAGGPNIEHTIAVHETPSEYDPPSWEGKVVQFTTGGHKYVERPLLEAENGMVQRIAEEVKLS